jgi:hypothetical protein
MRFDIETQASPEQVHRALTDFTQERLCIGNRTLDPKTYELREHGPTWAIARESTPRSPFWVVARYDWTDPSVVRLTAKVRPRKEPRGQEEGRPRRIDRVQRAGRGRHLRSPRGRA